MGKPSKKETLWTVACEGHRDAWVIAPNWELATVEAAKFWGVPWKEVAARCELKRRTMGAVKNVCCICGKTFFGSPPMCAVCRLKEQTEEEQTARRLKKAYRDGRAM